MRIIIPVVVLIVWLIVGILTRQKLEIKNLENKKF